ncbi:hypothetical protein [Herbaspirillum sp. B65]|uniref:hypothetical protein n=1 Tax=Herbaspirillum sp. B65 TaxID=137708 RepID=UPI0011D1AA1A|nr:hypothetical protein [Herbaspirillum sp. B65]
MDYFVEAFGGFDPCHDKDAALKFCLDIMMADHRLGELERLLSTDDFFGGVEGEPGWIIERRSDDRHPGYESWPVNARFRAYVEPDSYLLTYPEFFSDRITFARYVQAIVSVYKRRHPENQTRLQRIEAYIQTASTI